MGCQGKDSGKWATRHGCCRACGTTERPHRARGFCSPCYYVDYEARIRNSPGSGRIGRGRPSLKSQIPKPLMEKLYTEQKLSLQDIANRYKCTRVLVYYLMKDYGIPRRSHSKARRLAQRAGKIEYTVRLLSGNTRRIKQAGTNINMTFFREWSPAMAYVLGVFYSDGCLCVNRNGYLSASISQKEPELLEKCLALMNCDARLGYRPHNSPVGGLYTFTVNHQGVCRDLIGRGLHPKKSLTIEFPEMPAEMVRHFIRGCWDGDGCICKDGDRASSWRAIYCSGSQMFVASLHNALVHLGMQPARIHRDRRATVYTVRWSGWKCGTLFRILYDGVSDQQYLLRKYSHFRMAERETSEAPRRASRHRR